jgi:hypothetical protein
MLTRLALAAALLLSLSSSGAKAATFTVTLASLGDGSICADLACTGGALYTLTPTPQGSLGSGVVDVVGTSVTALTISLNGPLVFQPTGGGSPLTFSAANFGTASVASSSCLVVSTTAFCGVSLQGPTVAGELFATLNLTAVPEPASALLVALGLLIARRTARSR